MIRWLWITTDIGNSLSYEVFKPCVTMHFSVIFFIFEIKLRWFYQVSWKIQMQNLLLKVYLEFLRRKASFKTKSYEAEHDDLNCVVLQKKCAQRLHILSKTSKPILSCILLEIWHYSLFYTFPQSVSVSTLKNLKVDIEMLTFTHLFLMTI